MSTDPWRAPDEREPGSPPPPTPQAYPPQAYPPAGYLPQASPPAGYLPQAYPPAGYPPPGHPPQAYAPSVAPPPGPPQAWQQRPYPQLLRGPGHRWWRPLLGLAVVVGAILFLLMAGAVLTVAVELATQGSVAEGGSTDEAAFEEWLITPVGLLATNLTLASGIPIAMLAVWAGHRWRPRWVSSVRGGLRWSWMLRCAAVTVLVYIPLTTGAVLLDESGGSPEPQAALLLLVVLLTTPLQAAGEEYFFRGWLTQSIGSLVSRPVVGAVVATLISATLFAMAHGQQDPWLFLDRFAFGVVASWLVWRTGGLEAAIALHVVNNLVAFVLTILLGQLSDALTVTESSPVATVVDIVQMSVVALLLNRMARRRGIVRLFRPPSPDGSPVPPVGTPYRVRTGVWAPAPVAPTAPPAPPAAPPGTG